MKFVSMYNDTNYSVVALMHGGGKGGSAERENSFPNRQSNTPLHLLVNTMVSET